MNAFAEIINYVVSSLLGAYTLIVLLRFVLQLAKASFYNPISQGIVKITAPLLNPLRRIIPGFMGLDIAALVLAILLNMTLVIISLLLAGNNPVSALSVILIYAVLQTITSLMNIFAFALIVSIILSFVAPMSNHPAAMLVFQIAEPLMAPFRKLIPPMGGIDISPLFVFIAFGVLTRIIAIIGASVGMPVSSFFLFVFIQI